MALWYYQREPGAADPSERLVADALQRLGDEWIIRWGWYFGVGDGAENREGDFLIYGPGGHVLVMEVKGSAVRAFAMTGYWEGAESADPISQILAQWKAAIRRMEAVAGGAAIPPIHTGFAFPNVSLLPGDKPQGEMQKHGVLGPRDIGDFQGWWARNVQHGSLNNHCKDGRKLFLDAFAAGLRPAQVQLFIRDSERLFARFRNTEFGWLRRLYGNQQLLVRGGPGTGKTFMALKTASAFAEQGNGHDVLILCYNLALGQVLTTLAQQIKLKRGSLTVRTWEAFAHECLEAAGVELTPPQDKEAKAVFYDEELPGYVWMVCQDGRLPVRFDALVVDEGQDIDTAFAKAVPDGEGAAGWWALVFASLRDGPAARMAIFYDPAQRPQFRGPQFVVEQLTAVLSQPAHVRLDQAVRFTRPLFHYLMRMAGEPPHPLLEGLQPHRSAPAGPEPHELELDGATVDRAGLAAATADAIASILKDWNERGLCKPGEVILLGPRRRLADASIGSLSHIGCWPLETYPLDADSPSHTGSLRYLSINRAKGLDFLAVIIIDIPDPSAELDLFLFAATRAKQMLGVVRV
jgi:hypothetical protein